MQQQIQTACDDLYRDPNDAGAFSRLRQLLGAPTEDETGTVAGVVSQHSWRRLVRVAANQLYDDPENADAGHVLLLLLAAAKH